jgi:hypothetical protein
MWCWRGLEKIEWAEVLQRVKGKKNISVTKINLMHYLSSVHFVNQPLHVSGIFVAHHQEVYCIYIQQLVRVVLFR